MSDFIAVEGMQLEFLNPSEAGTFTMITPASVKVKASSKGVYKNNATVQVTNYTNGATINNGTGVGNFIATSTKVKADGALVLRKGDLASITGTYPNPSPPPATLPFSTTVRIKDAGQNKFKGL